MSTETQHTQSPLLSSREGRITRLVLNRPRAINALSLEMVESAILALQHAADDGSRAIVITGAGDRGLCGGGDIKEMAANNASGAANFVEREYTLDLMTAESPVPVVGIMDGITMGGGIGISGHAATRIVTERSRLAMPETKIGIVPDVGGHLLLAGAPGRIGEYLAVSSASMTAGDAIALGFADYFVHSERLEEMIVALAAELDDDTTVDQVVAKFAEPAPASQLLAEREWIEPLFEGALGGDDPVTLLMARQPGAADLAQWAIDSAQRLLVQAENSDQQELKDLGDTLRTVCPTSVVVTLAQIARTRALALNLSEVLADDLRVLTRLFRRPDFVEGVRATVIDKDGAPQWQPATIEDLEPNTITAILDPGNE